MTAFYSENDPYAAGWLRGLIREGWIAPGVVDQRDMREIEAFELAAYTQVHFCAGIGIWSYALRSVGWPDNRPIWSGSFPCQPFSQAGQRKGISDDRHLWPFGADLVRLCKPPIFVGEQVASPDGLAWFDHVSTDLENAGYAVGAADLCAAGVEGYHIRQRQYFVGMADDSGARLEGCDAREMGRQCAPIERGCGAGGMADDYGFGPSPRVGNNQTARHGPSLATDCGIAGGLADTEYAERRTIGFDGQNGRYGADGGRKETYGVAGTCGEIHGRTSEIYVRSDYVDWLGCRDAKWRPVEPATFPLADANSGRVGRLRAYGNALDAETAITFCRAVASIAGI